MNDRNGKFIMNILFITMATFSGINEHSIYPDLIRRFAQSGHNVYTLLPNEVRHKKATYVEKDENIQIIYVQTGNLFNVNMLTKLKSRVGVARRYIKTIRKKLYSVKFDIVLYSTPPITFYKVVNYVKRRDNAYSYLMLKDIFPQNAVDLGMISQNGLAFKFLRWGEKKLYRVSDTIGCMSPANKEFLLGQDPWIDESIVELCPNALDPIEYEFDDKNNIRRKYGIPIDKTVFVYGGGLGRPQGVEFLLSCIEKMIDDSGCFFLICGDGTYFKPLKSMETKYPNKIKLIKWLPVKKYNEIVYSSDVGLVFLNHNFRIPNFPSRILLYMECELPILAATDVSTDIGRIAKDNGFGDWCESICGNEEEFIRKMEQFKDAELRNKMGKKSKEYFKSHYTVGIVYDSVLKHFHSC